MVNIEVAEAAYLKDEYSLFVSFSYDPEKVAFIKKFEQRVWLKNKLAWEVPVDKLSDLLERFSNEDIYVSGKYLNISESEEITDTSWFNFKTDPYDHQIEGFLYGINHKKWFLGDQMGLGKTKQAIDIAVAMKELEGYKHCLILCGVNGLKWNWYDEVQIHSNEKAHILGTKIRKRSGEKYIGSNKDKVNDLKKVAEGKLDSFFLITNIESMRSKEIQDILVNLVDMKIIPMIVIDEAHKAIKANPNKSQQGKAVMKLKPEYRLPMTGTPLMNHPLDLYGLLAWVGLEKHSYYSFSHYYAEFGGYGGYEVIGYKHTDELESGLQRVMLRRLKSEVLDLPDKVYMDEYVDMLAQQKVIYDEIKADIKSNIDMLEISPNPLAEMIRMRQATGYTGILSSDVQVSAKLDRMQELVDEILDNGEKVLIFSNWTQITDEVYNRLEQYNPLVITGSTPDGDRQTFVDMFQKEDSHSIMIGTTGAIGTGLTLTAANNVIFLDEPWSTALKEQAIDRVHRIGQNNKSTIYTIMCKGTIDEKIHDLVYKKGQMSDMIVDGDITKINKAELVQYLLE